MFRHNEFKVRSLLDTAIIIALVYGFFGQSALQSTFVEKYGSVEAIFPLSCVVSCVVSVTMYQLVANRSNVVLQVQLAKHRHALKEYI